ncbi:MAG: S41 family peptidase [Elusimicrobiota bacterium]|jgi:carboxyl-terminal processing protease
MKGLLLSLLLAPAASAQLQYADFHSIRKAAHGRAAAVQSIGKIVSVEYKMVDGPAAEDPKTPPNLQVSQVNVLFNQIKRIQTHRGEEVTITEEQAHRLVQGLILIDIKFVDPISQERWNPILDDMAELAAKEFGTKTKDWDVIIDHMLQKALLDLKEPHSNYLEPKQVKELMEQLSGSVPGIGVLMGKVPEGLGVGLVFPNSGAQEAGLLEGDVIIAVNGSSIKGMDMEKAVELIRGPSGTRVFLRVVRKGRVLKPDFHVERREVELPNVLSKMAAPGIGYIYLMEFGQKSGERVLAAAAALKKQGAKSMILDVRGNPGGIVEVVAAISSEFLKDGDDIVSFKHQGQIAKKAVTVGDGDYCDTPVAVLVDGGSASASEIMAGALQDKRGGYTIIGSRSYGKGTEQAIIGQANDRALKITENRWYTPEDRNIDAKHTQDTGAEIPGTGGVVPDLEVNVSDKQAEEILKNIQLELLGKPVPAPRAEDPVLKKAVEVLSGANAG